MNVTKHIMIELRGYVDLRIPRIFDVSCRICYVYLGDLMHHHFINIWTMSIYLSHVCIFGWLKMLMWHFKTFDI